MPESDVDPMVKAVCEDRAHAISQMIIDTRMGDQPFPGEEVQNVINLAVGDNTVGYLCYYLATAYDVAFKNLVELKQGGS